MTAMIDAILSISSPDVLAIMLLSAVFGLFVGATPGLTATMATALLVPITFFMPPVAAIAAIVTCSAMAIFAGDIPAALLRIPGTPASAAYTDDTFELNRKGRLDLALGTNVTASAVGGIIGTLLLVYSAPLLAEFAMSFSSFEYFWLALLGLSCAALVSAASPAKGAISLALGLWISTIGLDSGSGLPRYTFGLLDLQGGASLIAVLIGAFAVAELLRKAIALDQRQPDIAPIRGSILKGQAGVLWRHRTGLLRGSLTGSFVGVLPGAGADVAAWMSYAISKRFSKTPELYGTGHVEGVVEASASNNASLSGAYVPALVFGIPGDSITAIVIGVLMIKGITPGPSVFTNSPDLVAAIYAVFFAANLLMVPLGIAAIYLGRIILRMQPGTLYPVILLFCVIGAFATNNAIFDIWIILVVGFVVWIMEANGYPAAPMVLGVVLGRLVEETFVNSMIKEDGSLIAFFERPLSATLGVVTLIVWSLPVLKFLWRRAASRAPRPDGATGISDHQDSNR
jgi:TctA family transporter